jgi:hypothetical protein
METEKITFPNVAGELLSARLDLPEDEPPLAYALFAHCFACTKNMDVVVHISRALTSNRIALLRFDFTGHGESEGDFSRTTFSSQVSDLKSAASFLKKISGAQVIDRPLPGWDSHAVCGLGNPLRNGRGHYLRSISPQPTAGTVLRFNLPDNAGR